MGKKILALISIILLWGLPVWADSLRVFFLDVGEGDAIYLETQEKKILVDTGNLITGYRVVNFLKERDIRQLDALIITHPHPDHMGGVFHVLQHLIVNELYDNGQPLEESTEDIYRWYTELYRGKNYRALMAGEIIKAGDALIAILWPEKLSQDWNENSLILRVTHGEVVFLLMGDAGIETEKALLNEDLPLGADVLKVGHHGARGTTSEVFLEAVSPTYAVISINEGNMRGYPDPNVVEKFIQKGIKFFYTYRNGDIGFESNGKSVGILPPPLQDTKTGVEK
jgi:competence protein ComEC